MNDFMKLISSILLSVLIYFSLVGVRTHVVSIDEFDYNFFLQIFTLILAVLGIFMFKIQLIDKRTIRNKKLVKYFWMAIVISVLFFIFIGITYFLHYHIGPFPLYFSWGNIYRTFEILISVIFGVLLYHIL